MSDLTDRLRARADQQASRARLHAKWLMLGLTGREPVTDADAFFYARLSAEHAGVALDLREAADLIDKSELRLSASAFADVCGDLP